MKKVVWRNNLYSTSFFKGFHLHLMVFIKRWSLLSFHGDGLVVIMWPKYWPHDKKWLYMRETVQMEFLCWWRLSCGWSPWKKMLRGPWVDIKINSLNLWTFDYVLNKLYSNFYGKISYARHFCCYITCVSVETCKDCLWKPVIHWLFCQALRFLAFRSHLLVCYESQKHPLSDNSCQTMKDNGTNV